MILIISLKEMTDADRLNSIAQKGSKILNITPEAFISYMDNDFLRAFMSGYYGSQIMLIAAEQYVKEIELEVS